MKKAIRIRTVSQWYLLKQLNCYLGKRKFPKEVMRKIYHILSSKKLGKDGLSLCALGRYRTIILELRRFWICTHTSCVWTKEWMKFKS